MMMVIIFIIIIVIMATFVQNSAMFDKRSILRLT